MEGFKMGKAHKVLLFSHVKELKRERDYNLRMARSQGIEEAQNLLSSYNKRKW
jgi:hypothetical protein